MYRSAKRRRVAAGEGNSSLSPQRKRIIAVVGTLAVFGGIIAVTQVSSAQDLGTDTVSCPSVADRLPNIPAGARNDVERQLALLETQIKDANQRLSVSEGQGGPNFVNNTIVGPLNGKRVAAIDRIEIAFSRFGERPEGLRELANCTVNGSPGTEEGSPGAEEGNPADEGDEGDEGNEGNEGDEGEGGGPDILANNCDNSALEPHDGFQNDDRCVSTAFGEVGARPENPTLLIVESPDQVDVNQPFSFQVSTRNLVRDRFLAAADGGYYVESSVLNEDGLQRGHFHSACRSLGSEDEAPLSDPVPEFFVATEDGGGGAQPDTVEIEVAGLPTAGTYQCSSWAGDGSHRIPMMVAANQTPAFDSFRLQVN